MAVHGFFGEYRFLSNFWMSDMVIRGESFASVEHFFQACKATSESDFQLIRKMPKPGQCKAVGKQIKIRPDWDRVKFDIMLTGVRAKFTQNEHLGNLLIDTDGHLEETNHWGDTIWGVCNGKGTNWLGQILMQVRKELNFEEMVYG